MEVTVRYVGFWRRFVAWLIDAIILVIISVVKNYYPFPMSWETLVLHTKVTLIADFIIPIIYAIGFWTWRGQTPGKMIMRVRIIKTDGSPIGIGRAILRYVGYVMSAIIICIGYLMIAWDGRKQGLHDKIAGTVVIRSR